jgi:spore coat protein A
MVTRRQFLKLGAATSLGFLVACNDPKLLKMESLEDLQALGLIPLDAAGHPKYVNPLPAPARIDATAGGLINVGMGETSQWLGLVDSGGHPLMTPVWGYGQSDSAVTYPGPTLVAMRDVPVRVNWHNKLPQSRNLDSHLLPVDMSLHMAHPAKGGIPTVAHLHGGHTESASDGLPEQWFTQGWSETGPYFAQQTFNYDNDQQAATLWYHDHALGITRLNVYAGLAGFYLLRDENEIGLMNDGVLPSGPYEREIVIQDRMFTADGQLFIPTTDPELPPGAPDPSIIAEFFGDFILVNGVAWPKLDVEPRKYRFRMLNGSDSRFYVLRFDNGHEFLQIGTDNGLLRNAVELTQLLLAPGERADLVVDFSDCEGEDLLLQNLGPDEPFKGLGIGDSADSQTTGQVMKFCINLPISQDPDATVKKGTSLNKIKFPRKVDQTRQLVLFEGEDEFGRLRPQLGTLADGSLLWDETITENPKKGDTEIWEIYNATEDAHPIHLHLVSFEILDRRQFTGVVEQEVGDLGTKQKLLNPKITGPTKQPEPNERGLKDTAVMLPGQVTRIKAKFDRLGRYVWHCHILSHEDHEMMRPFEVV